MTGIEKEIYKYVTKVLDDFLSSYRKLKFALEFSSSGEAPVNAHQMQDNKKNKKQSSTKKILICLIIWYSIIEELPSDLKPRHVNFCRES